MTANKALLATHGAELAEIADRRSAALLGSASVGGGTPMIETTEHMASTGEIARLRGVVNATTTYILSAMGQGQSYEEALDEAQAAGYAEADPSFDVDGHDAAQKLAILASWPGANGARRPTSRPRASSGGRVEAGDVVRLVADGTPDELTVRPKILDQLDPLAVDRGRRELPRDRDAATAPRSASPGRGPAVP